MVYSDLDIGFHHSDLNDIVDEKNMSSSLKFGDMKKSAPSKNTEHIMSDTCYTTSSSVASPSTPRRVSSKWHPSLLKLNMEHTLSPNTRSVSAERVRATRALYSSWHREMVSKSKEKLSVSKGTNHSTLNRDAKLHSTIGRPKTFLLGRRAVSESRFTIEDRVLSPQPIKYDFKSSNLPNRINKKVDRSNSVTFKQSNVCKQFEKNSRVLSVSPPRRIMSPNSECSEKFVSLGSDYGRPPISRHTVSSKIKTKSFQDRGDPICSQNHIVCRSRSADYTNSLGRTKHHTCCTPTEDPDIPKTLPRRNTRPKGLIRNLSNTENKRLRQSESFDTTHSNETGYSSMLDLSPSPSPENIYYSRSTERSKDKCSKKMDKIMANRKFISPKSTVVRRTVTTEDYAERRAKWESWTKIEKRERYKSSSPPRSLTPLRSTNLVRQASNSIKRCKSIETDDRPRRCHSLDTVKPSQFKCPNKYRQYILELRLAAPQNAKVSNLRRLFTSLDRAYNLERSISSVDLSVIERKASYLLGFEAWKNLKDTERKALEYKLLMKELNAAQINRDFLYRVSPEKKWKGDAYLHGKDESVREIKDKFMSCRNYQYAINKDQIKRKNDAVLKEKAKHTYSTPVSRVGGSRHGLTREDCGRRSAGMWTSLSMEQVDALKGQLNDIYGSMQDIQTWQERKKLSRSKSQKERGEIDHDCCNSVNILQTGNSLAAQLNKFNLKRASLELRPLSSEYSPVTQKLSDANRVEAERRKLSKQLSIELKEKVHEQQINTAYLSKKRSTDSCGKRTPSTSPDGSTRYSPRTCYSLDISDSSQPSSLTYQNDDQLFLLLQKPTRSRSLPPDLNDDGESSDSDMSVRTVIHKDVAGKVKFFEKRARKNSRSSERQSSQSSHISLICASELRQQNKNLNYLSKKNIDNQNNSLSNIKGFVHSENRTQMKSNIRHSDYETKYSRSYLKHVKTGDVFRLKERYESSERINCNERKRTNSLPNLRDTLARATPENRTVIRMQENGDVNYMKLKYETPRKSRSPTRWVPNRDEYIPKSKISSTLERLGVISDAFYEPETVQRVSLRDSVEKQVLKRVQTGHVNSTVGKLETKIHLNSDVSILGQMYTSSPSLTELAKMSPLVPPRPTSPIAMAPKKPQRLYQPSASKGPLQTSTPTISPIREKMAMRVITPPEMNRCFAGNNFPNYNAEHHRPKSRYIPLDSQGAVSWTRSLERPKRLTKASTVANTTDPFIHDQTMSSYSSSYSSCNKRMSIPSSRLSYSSTFSTVPSRSSIASQTYFPTNMNSQRYVEPCSLPYIPNTLRSTSYCFQGDFPEPDNYYQLRPRNTRLDCRSLSPPRQQLASQDYLNQRRSIHLSPPPRLPSQENAYNQLKNRDWDMQPLSLPSGTSSRQSSRYSFHPQLHQKYHHTIPRAPPRPPTRNTYANLNVTLPRSHTRLQTTRDLNYNKAVTWKGAVKYK